MLGRQAYSTAVKVMLDRGGLANVRTGEECARIDFLDCKKYRTSVPPFFRAIRDRRGSPSSVAAAIEVAVEGNARHEWATTNKAPGSASPTTPSACASCMEQPGNQASCPRRGLEALVPSVRSLRVSAAAPATKTPGGTVVGLSRATQDIYPARYFWFEFPGRPEKPSNPTLRLAAVVIYCGANWFKHWMTGLLVMPNARTCAASLGAGIWQNAMSSIRSGGEQHPRSE